MGLENNGEHGMARDTGSIYDMLTRLCLLQGTGVFLLQGKKLISFQEGEGGNPLYQCGSLREDLTGHADWQDAPYIWKDAYQVYFACVKTGQGYYLLGPMGTEKFNRAARHLFYREYGIAEHMEKNLRQFSLMEVLQFVCLIAQIVSGAEYTDQELVDANHLSLVSKAEENTEQVKFTIQSEDEDFYRHSYQEERELLHMVREGKIEEAVRLAKEMDLEVGRLGSDELAHWRNVLIVGAALCARAAIEGGVAPYIAYRISGFYINKGSSCRDVTQILTYRNHAIEELAARVHEIKGKRHISSYTAQCKDYIRKHFREKIYLDDIAQTLGISSCYLSRLFKKETGICIQDYVNDERIERAANLLIYSGETIPKIAEYVNFPSQSYFGKLFKARKGMTPRQFREMYKPAEFIEKR